MEIPKALKSSEQYIELINQADWKKIWDISAETYKKNYDFTRLLRLKAWIDFEFGPFIEYKLIYFYSGSKIGFFNRGYITTRYEIMSNRGYGEIELQLVKENGEYRLTSLSIYKIPKI
ncbi:MAG: hypothetical protein MJB14_21350 [Spirochaetes bacterium]|nr:hypothetical protein [Spirochaetota bacterium]